MLDVVRHNLDLIRFFGFLFLLFLGARILVLREPSARRAGISLFIAYMVTAHVVVGVSQRDAWPFSPYPLMRGTWDESWQYSKIVVAAVDETGKEWPIDPMAWSPVFPLVLQEWLITYYPGLSARGKETALAFLLEKVENARRDSLRGRYIGSERILGPFAAPDWWLYERVREVSPEPITRLRIYRELWYPAVRARDASAFKRQLIDEYARR